MMEREAAKLGLSNGRGRLMAMKWAVSAHATMDPVQYFPGLRTPVYAPFGFAPTGISQSHFASVDTGYFDGLMNVLTPKATQRKIAEVRSSRNGMLLIPENMNAACTIDASAEAKLIQVLFFVPWRPRPRHGDEVLTPLCAYIAQNYRLRNLSPNLSLPYNVWILK